MYQVTQNNNLFNLSLNENYFSFCKEELLKLENLNRYPNVAMYEEIQAEARKLYQTSQPILLTNGSDDGIFLIQQWFKAKWKSGAGVVITNPTFSMYENYAKNLGIDVEKVKLDANLEISIEDLILKIKENPNCLVFIPNPNSPTGTMLSSDAIKLLLQQKATIVIDEAYIEFSGKESAISLLAKHKNLIILRTLSKFYGLAGVRIGFVIGGVALDVKKFQAPFSVSCLNSAIALKTLKYVNENKNDVDGFVNQFIKEREEMVEKLVKKPSVERIYKTDANFILMKVKNVQEILQNFQNHNILIKDFSSILPNTVRFSLAGEDINAKILECL